MSFKKLPLRLKLLISAQTVLGVIALALAWRQPAHANWGVLAFLTLFGIIGGACKVDLTVTFGRLSLGFTVTYFALILFGTSEALIVGLAGTIASQIFNLKRTKNRICFPKALSVQAIYNYGNGILATVAMGWVFYSLGGRPQHFDLATTTLPILASALTYYLVNTAGVSLAIAWAENISPVKVYREHWAWAWPGFLAGACLSAVLVWAYRSMAGGPQVLLLVPPAYLVYYFYRLRSDKANSDLTHVQELNRLNDAVIGSLAMAIEAKDRYTRKHVNRVREYAVRLGEKLRVSADELHAIRIASLLHDIGKIGIPEHILCKPGKLTSEEFEIIKSHVEIGAAILDRIDFPWPVAPIVRTHHERWDGLGYPTGLVADAIPIGGRIISLVDVYDALTSDRPYRRAIPREQAIEILRAGSNSQFDPDVVEAFIAMLPEMDAAIAAIQAEADCEPELIPVSPRTTRAVTAADEAEDAIVLDELADLVRSETGIMSIAPRLAEKISKLVPYTTFSLYLTSSDFRSLIPIYTTGLWTEMLDGIEIRVGEGVTGYAAAKGETLLNAAAALDLARRLRPSDNLELNSTLCVPLLLCGEVIGTLTLYHSSYNFYQPFHAERLNRISRYAVEAIEQSRRQASDLPLPAEDLVTRLPNTYSLLQFLRGEVTVAQTREEQFSVISLSVEAASIPPQRPDLLERERVMQVVAKVILETVRDKDFVARASANGFALVLPRCGEREARRTARRVLERAQTEGLEQGLGDASSALALRAGIAGYPRDGANPEALLNTSRERLGEIPPEPARQKAVAAVWAGGSDAKAEPTAPEPDKSSVTP
jgi:putative nucleotidyltransferase with HDIG domain/diguanylate cyclase (GGDEF)-like protein